MAPILTITFSPCIDKSTSVDKLIPEKKLKCVSPKLEAGGGGINVARAVIKLGGKATAIYAAGGYTGKYFTRLLADENVPAICIETENETRENIIVLETSTNLQFRFGMPGLEMKEPEWQQMLKAVEEFPGVEFIVASGSLPPDVPVDIFARIASIAKRKGAKFIVDTSGEALKKAVEEGVYLLKPNLAELSSLVGKEHLQPGEIAEAAKKIIRKKNCQAIVVSIGPVGAMLVTKEKAELISAPPIKRKSTVGAGDSMVAGIVIALSKGESFETAAQYGVACGTAAAMNAGTELCHKEDADHLLTQIKAAGSFAAGSMV